MIEAIHEFIEQARKMNKSDSDSFAREGEVGPSG